VEAISLWVELKCPEHGFERFRIKIIRRSNMNSHAIMPKFRSRPRRGTLSRLLVGRNVCDKEIKSFMTEYFRRRGLMKAILRMKLEV